MGYKQKSPTEFFLLGFFMVKTILKVVLALGNKDFNIS